ncbi:hypothetical protein C1878_00100 [Gordonibacter sp. 28C]|uniref:FtsX-like permease family protein n=1 Tax=Gordonibacter sp. 28C TaxID=2078569 RepID=UPI000DF7235B|nr:FtsX-like permease family protein [Gordonibacter sp. 28C]RDB64308.1 hypothetical protein C1878_00100 [Gordonibacter sp. 28C]
MGAFKRAIRYLTRNPGKTALLVAVVFATSLTVMASAGIIEGASELSDKIKEGSRPSVAVYREDDESISAATAGDLSGRGDVAAVNRMGQVDALPVGFNAIEAAVPDPGWDDAVRVHAFDDLSQGSPFEDQLLRLAEGRLVEPGDEGAVLLHSDLAEVNGLHVGDTVRFRSATGEETEAKVVGLFAAAGGSEGDQGLSTARTQSFNQVYADCETAVALGMAGFGEVRVSPVDPDGAAKLADAVDADLGAGYLTEVLSSAYDKVAPALNSTVSSASAVLALTAAVAIAAVSSILALWGKGRVHERAVLLSLGASRAKVFAQAGFESLFVAALAVAASSAVAATILPPLLSSALPQQASQSGVPAVAIAAAACAAVLVPIAASVAVAAATTARNPVELFSERS